MKHVEIDEKLHDLLKFYCFVKQIPMKQYINTALKNLPELKEFEKERKILKKLRR